MVAQLHLLILFQILLLLSLVMTIVNLINLIILEVGEWRGFLSHDDKEFVRDNGLEDLMTSGDPKLGPGSATKKSSART